MNFCGFYLGRILRKLQFCLIFALLLQAEIRQVHNPVMNWSNELDNPTLFRLFKTCPDETWKL